MHPHAAVAGGRAELRFGIGAVDVDVAVEGVRVFRVKPREPEDARLNVILFIALLTDESGRDATDENLAWRRAVAMFLRDAEASGRRAIRARLSAEAEARRGDDIAADERAVFEQVEGLRGNVDEEFQKVLS